LQHRTNDEPRFKMAMVGEHYLKFLCHFP